MGNEFDTSSAVPVNDSMILRILLLTLAIAWTGCSALPGNKSPLSEKTEPTRLIRTELYYGAIPLPAWNKYLAEVVTPRFPDGLSWFDLNGQWLGRSGKVSRLPSRVLVILHEPSLDKDRKVDEARKAFTTQFDQQSVLRVSVPVEASF